jgi:hypothetical protein
VTAAFARGAAGGAAAQLWWARDWAGPGARCASWLKRSRLLLVLGLLLPRRRGLAPPLGAWWWPCRAAHDERPGELELQAGDGQVAGGMRVEQSTWPRLKR